ncbi:UNVERIFIED_CONTAM: hypothetical protein GTU68_008536 [Idotea baltica]|nr:hypothetical protein [Idotea baltica]
MMPIMDGFELCAKIKSDPRTDHIPVIMLTARADFDSKMEGLELGANAYLPKPFEKQELLFTIKNLFELRDNLRKKYQHFPPTSQPERLQDADSVLSKSEDAFVVNVREFIEKNLTDFDLNVEQIAQEMHLSHSQFGRKLDALTGYTPKQFIRFIRLNKSRELLQDPERSITSVAYDCGFKDPSYFSRVFKKEIGKTPVAWRMEVL